MTFDIRASGTRSRRRSAIFSALLVAGTMACSGKWDGPPTLAGDLQGDLDAAAGSSVQLAGEDNSRRTRVVSAEELTGTAPAPRAPQTASRATPRSASSSSRSISAPAIRSAGRTPAPAAAPAAPSVVTLPTPEPMVNPDTLAPIVPRPTPSQPAGTPSRRGGYKSVSDVIRDAPFPINP
jgi:hypothetical protein